jgi:hypothetical protein
MGQTELTSWDYIVILYRDSVNPNKDISGPYYDDNGRKYFEWHVNALSRPESTPFVGLLTVVNGGSAFDPKLWVKQCCKRLAVMTGDTKFHVSNAIIQQSQTDSFLDATNAALGVNDIFNTNYTIQDILNFNVFRYKTKLASPDKNNLPIYVNSYLLIRIGAEPEDNYFMFSEVQNKLLNQNITMELLDRVPAINQIKEIINNQKEKSNVDSNSNTNGEISNGN